MNKRIFWKKVKQQGSVIISDHIVAFSTGSKKDPKKFLIIGIYQNNHGSFETHINKPLGKTTDYNFWIQHNSLKTPPHGSKETKHLEVLSSVNTSSHDGLLLSESDIKQIPNTIKSIKQRVQEIYRGIKGVFKHGKKASN